MLSPNTTSMSTAVPVDRLLRKIHVVCAKHNVSFGSPDDLAAFLVRLREDRHLAMDFWSLNAAISSNDGEELPEEQVFQIIVYALTGCEFPEEVRKLGDPSAKSLDDLRDLFRGVDIDNPLRDSPPAPEPPAPAASPATESRTDKRQEKENVRRPEGVSKAVSAAAAIAGRETWNAPAGADESSKEQLQQTKDELQNTLQQLEQNYRGLLRHLDRIDKRLNGLQAQPDDQASMSAWAAASPHTLLEETPRRANYDGVSLQPLRKVENSRIVLTEPHPAPSQDVEIFPTDNPPLRSFTEKKEPGKLGINLTLLVIVSACVFTTWKYHQTIHQQFEPILRKVIDFYPAANAEPAAIAPAAPSAPLPTSEPPAAAAVGRAVDTAVQTVKDSVGTPDADSASPPSETPSSSASQRRNRPSDSEEDSFFTLPGSSRSADAVPVPAAVMQSNLITSRVPAYPADAKAERVEGKVVLQAIISKEGTVDDLRVIDGNPMLRNAAIDAVSKWHYRPYIQNGRPVEVSTTIRVDFRLPNS
jgi:TonB family protein